MHYLIVAVSSSLLILFAAGSTHAQTDRATLEGTVTDSSSAILAGTTVKITAITTAQSLQRTTNASGNYRFPGVAAGFYVVEASRNGFKTKLIEDVELQVGETHTLDIRLDVGEVAERVEVSAQLSPAERSSAESSTVIRADQIDNLPVNGRNWATLTLFAPWAQDDGGGDQRTIRFAGRARDDNYFSFDGIDATGIQEQAQKSQTRLQVSEDAIAEYRVGSALYDAEYGSQAGGQVDVVTKSGTNDFHGTLFGYFRNSDFDARAFVDPSSIPPFRLGQYGLTFGGPIIKDKTFFFLSYEGLRQYQAHTIVAAVPSPTLQEDVLVNGRFDSTNSVFVGPSPQMCQILQSYPWRASAGTIAGCTPRFLFPDSFFTAIVGTGPEANDVDNFTHPGNIRVHEDSWLVRFDHKFSDKTSLYARAQRDISFSYAPLGNALDQQGITNHPGNYIAALQHTFSPNLFDELKFGINRSPFHNPQYGIFPLAINSNNFEGLNNSNTDNEVGTTFSVIDNLTFIRGRHTFKTGIEVRRIRLNQGITADNTVDFTDDLSLIGASVNDFTYRSNWCCHGLRRTLYMPYFQDEMKITPTLTVNLGVRWDYYGVAHEAHNRTTVFDLQQFGGVCVGSGSNNPLKATEPSTCPVNPSMYPANYRNWDPRVAFAWAPSALHSKTVIRSGFGIYSGAAQNDDLNAALESDNVRIGAAAPAPYTFIFSDGYLQDPPNFGVSTTAEPRPRALIRKGRRDLYVEEWGLTVDQALPGSFLLTTSYLGSHGVRLFARSYENVCIGDSNGTPAGCQTPLPNFGIVDDKQDVGTSSYNGLLLSLQRRITNGWSFQTNYTYSHSINDGSVGGGEANAPENVACRACDRGPSVFDIRHNLVFDTVYELPIGPGKKFLTTGGVAGKIMGGWALSSAANWHTGHPLTVIFGPSASQIPDGNDQSNQRPDLVPGVSLTPPCGRTSTQWINPAAFAEPPIDPVTGLYTHFGDAGNGIVRAPSVWDIDLSLSKTTKLTERFGLEFRVDAFNVFNHTQLGDPGDLNFEDNTFGMINTTVNFNSNNDNFAPPNTGTGVPRQLQFVVRLTY